MLTIVLVVMAGIMAVGALVAYDSRKHNEHNERASLAGASDELKQELMRRHASGQMPSRHAH